MSNPTTAVEADIVAIKTFSSSYRAYWGVSADGSEREPVKDRDALRRRLHRQLPRVEKIMNRVGTNGFGFKPPPIARGAPPRLGVVAVAFADEDPIFSVGGGPSCFEEVLNRLEMTLGVLENELEENQGQPESVPQQKSLREQSSGSLQPTSESVTESEDPLATDPGAKQSRQPRSSSSPIGIFFSGVRHAWGEAAAARQGRGNFRAGLEVCAAIATIAAAFLALGAVLGWWGG